jgi:aspartyl-tRNA(Asn)/glutamyl-tRNA(Gln) amidotransferase subunit B
MSIPFDAYETVIGFECHVQLKTNSKLFSRGKNTYGAAPNSVVDVVDLGLPGVLPTINKTAVEMAVKLGLALNCQIRHESVFARKHYFYPDLPKGYQISQFDRPICENGHLDIFLNGEKKTIRITRIHMEEDAGKNIHAEGVNASFVDYNRAGVPLLEIVTEPDMRTPEEGMEVFKAIRQIVISIGVCDGNMQEGSLRADANVSVRKIGATQLGTRAEVKNLNSFKFLGNAISFETRRQIIELESGGRVVQETRLWDPNRKETRSLRQKEEAHDYRYLPDPDLPPLVLEQKYIDDIAKTLPELPRAKLERYVSDLGLSEYDAQIISSQKSLAEYFETALREHKNAKGLANWIINEVLRGSKSNTDEETADFHSAVSASRLAELVKLVDSNVISQNIGKKVFAELEKHGDQTPMQIVEKNQWQVISDDSSLLKFVDDTVAKHPNEVARYKAGDKKLLGFLMGQMMKAAGGKMDAGRANQLLLKALDDK